MLYLVFLSVLFSKCLISNGAAFPGNDDELNLSEDEAQEVQTINMPGEPFNPSEFDEAKKTELIPNPLGSKIYENEVQFHYSFNLRNGLTSENKRWPKSGDDAVIPYLISSQFSSSDRLKIVKAFDNFHENTCIRFVPRVNQRDYVHILSNGGCDSDAGRSGGEQTLSLGQNCVYTDIAIHELNHAVGFWHEQNRPDRDSYITIYLQNVIAENRFNFDKMTPSQVNAYGQKYDTGSIMHYDKFAFSKDYGKLIVMEPKVADPNMGLATVLSKTDIAKINKMYRCSAVKKGQGPSKHHIFKELKVKDDCVDNHDSCESFALVKDGNNYCETNLWVKVNCRKACSFCGSMCEDNHENCSSWALNGECQSHPDYMHAYCAKSCFIC